MNSNYLKVWRINKLKHDVLIVTDIFNSSEWKYNELTPY